LRRGRGPDDLQAATDRVPTMTSAKFVAPSEALILDVGSFRIRADILSGNASAVSFAESVTTGDQRNCFFVIHRHASKCFANIPGRCQGIRLSVGSLRIHIDQTHLHGSERILQVAVATVALVRQPCSLRTPEDVLFGLPDVLPTAAKAEGFEAHRFESDVAGENHEVGPGGFSPILLLRPPSHASR